jgi:rhombotail lipoprotein
VQARRAIQGKTQKAIMNTKKTRSGFRTIQFALASTMMLLLAGCAIFGGGMHHRQTSASVVHYLFPRESNPRVRTGVPVLKLPVRAGIAFVPTDESHSGYDGIETLSDSRKMELLRRVTSQFQKYDYIKSIEHIPSAYLRPGGSFENLEQLQRMFDIDIVVLLSYDQMQFTDEDFTTLAYWTIVGAYIVEGEKNDTQTMLDAVVYDIATRTLLFRAPGTSHLKGRSTPVNLTEELRRDREKSFELAATNLVASLDQELAGFRQKVKERPEEYHVMKQAGYTGAGAFDYVNGVILFLVVNGFVA